MVVPIISWLSRAKSGKAKLSAQFKEKKGMFWTEHLYKSLVKNNEAKESHSRSSPFVRGRMS